MGQGGQTLATRPSLIEHAHLLVNLALLSRIERDLEYRRIFIFEIGIYQSSDLTVLVRVENWV